MATVAFFTSGERSVIAEGAKCNHNASQVPLVSSYTITDLLSVPVAQKAMAAMQGDYHV